MLPGSVLVIHFKVWTQIMKNSVGKQNVNASLVVKFPLPTHSSPRVCPLCVPESSTVLEI